MEPNEIQVKKFIKEHPSVKIIRFVVWEKDNCTKKVKSIAESHIEEDENHYGLFTKKGKFKAHIKHWIKSVDFQRNNFVELEPVRED